MNTGQYISGIGHAGLIGWALFGGMFQSEPLPFDTTEVSVISAEAFDALLTTGPQPDTATDVALPIAPDVEPDPVLTPTPDETVTAETPDPAPQPETETVPETPQTPVQPIPEVVDTAPVAPQPQDLAAQVPEIAPEAVPRPSERVAPEAVAPPDPEATPDPVEQEAVTADEGAETPSEEQEATAPEEAATEIVTEAEQPASAPRTSLRPPSQRPSRPTPVAETPKPNVAEAADTPVDTPVDTSGAVNDALREAMAAEEAGGTAEVPAGPPLSAGEKDSLRVSVSSCWNVGSLSSDALQTTVVVAFDMSRDGRPVGSSIRMVSSSGGSAVGAKQAYETARRAIIRCTGDGYKLPVEKYGQWKEIEITFNPERMRIK